MLYGMNLVDINTTDLPVLSPLHTHTHTHTHRIGFPMMLITTLTASVYLIICHQAIQWNTEDARECVARKTSSLALSLV